MVAITFMKERMEIGEVWFHVGDDLVSTIVPREECEVSSKGSFLLVLLPWNMLEWMLWAEKMNSIALFYECNHYVDRMFGARKNLDKCCPRLQQPGGVPLMVEEKGDKVPHYNLWVASDYSRFLHVQCMCEWWICARSQWKCNFKRIVGALLEIHTTPLGNCSIFSSQRKQLVDNVMKTSTFAIAKVVAIKDLQSTWRAMNDNSLYSYYLGSDQKSSSSCLDYDK